MSILPEKVPLPAGADFIGIEKNGVFVMYWQISQGVPL
jgi:hypothetical protein